MNMKLKPESPLCPFRLIGRVQILDLIPRLSGKEGEAWLEVVSRHFFQGQQKAVVVNLSRTIETDGGQLRHLVYLMEKALKRAFFSNNVRHAEHEVQDYVNDRMPLLADEEGVVDYFGLELIERKKEVLPLGERRKFRRFKVVMPCEIIAKTVHPFATKAIVTNISEGGAFVQYLDLESSIHVVGLQPSPKVPVELVLKHPGSFECDLVKGHLIRVDLLGQQTGVAICFNKPLDESCSLAKRFKVEGEATGEIQA
jgi:hypothetical protein